MKEDFILTLIDKFENSSAVSLHIKTHNTELSLTKNTTPHGKQIRENACAVESSSSTYSSDIAVPNSISAGNTVSCGTNEGAALEKSTTAMPQHSTKQHNELAQIKSPIVGTFFRSPSPDSPSYVEKGMAVKKGQPLCVLEAMKMMNTLEAEMNGTIEDIFAENGDLVAFDQILFTIRPE